MVRFLELKTMRIRKTNADLMDMVRHEASNRSPTMNLQTHEYNGHELDVLEIRNRPDKPFYLTPGQGCEEGNRSSWGRIHTAWRYQRPTSRMCV